MKIEAKWRMLNPVADRNEDMFTPGEKVDTCDHGLPRVSLSVKAPASLGGNVKTTYHTKKTRV